MWHDIWRGRHQRVKVQSMSVDFEESTLIVVAFVYRWMCTCGPFGLLYASDDSNRNVFGCAFADVACVSACADIAFSFCAVCASFASFYAFFAGLLFSFFLTVAFFLVCHIVFVLFFAFVVFVVFCVVFAVFAVLVVFAVYAVFVFVSFSSFASFFGFDEFSFLVDIFSLLSTGDIVSFSLFRNVFLYPWSSGRNGKIIVFGEPLTCATCICNTL